MLPEILQRYPEMQVPADQTVLSQGQHCENCFVITQGCVKVFGRSAEGRELVLYRINSGEICVLTTACLLSNDSFPAEAISETAVTARVIPLQDFRRLLGESEGFREFVFDGFSQRLANLMQQLESITLASVDQRLLRYLLSNADHKQQLHATHQYIAIEIGSAREVVSRHLKSLEKQGLIRLQRGCIEVLRQAELSAMLPES
ncbi:Crp/Fnr family transcriptional regulator [Aliamphritea hakodatensis]|uniref:Crp/Fnr family transcriptional regulator n=1 Tax=Aliamphritea hakodatensis TaxID=2895352 RepID=UPI0022FD874B|nr:Crp/Fnr family transcriptional regulator [Aliamphritea hakodatensis]